MGCLRITKQIKQGLRSVEHVAHVHHGFFLSGARCFALLLRNQVVQPLHRRDITRLEVLHDLPRTAHIVDQTHSLTHEIGHQIACFRVPTLCCGVRGPQRTFGKPLAPRR